MDYETFQFETFQIGNVRVGDRVYTESPFLGLEGIIAGKHPEPEKDLLLIEIVRFYSSDTVRLMWKPNIGSVGELFYYWRSPSELGAGWHRDHPEPDWWIVPKSQRRDSDLREFSKKKPDVPWEEILIIPPDY